jgi:hypothetical protein
MLGGAVELTMNLAVTHWTIPSSILSRWFSDTFSGGLPAFAQSFQGARKREPGISRFPDAQLRICDRRFATSGMTNAQ